MLLVPLVVLALVRVIQVWRCDTWPLTLGLPHHATLETALRMARQGSKVCIATKRTTENTQKAMKDLYRILSRNHDNPAELVFQEELDLASFKSVREFAERWKKSGRPIHFLICNAGVIMPKRAETEDGYEVMMQVNYLCESTLLVLNGIGSRRVFRLECLYHQ